MQKTGGETTGGGDSILTGCLVAMGVSAPLTRRSLTDMRRPLSSTGPMSGFLNPTAVTFFECVSVKFPLLAEV